MLHQAIPQSAETMSQGAAGLKYWNARYQEPSENPDHSHVNQIARQAYQEQERALHARAFDVSMLAPGRWEVIRILDDESVWMQTLELEDATEAQAVQSAIAASHRFKRLPD
jgi:hypothetical protein